MLTKADLELRQRCITATDARRLALGVFGTASDVYAEKVGLEPVFTPEQLERFEIGHMVEEHVTMPLLAKRSGLHLRPSATMQHPILTWVAATPDALAYANPEGFGLPEAVCEGKNVGSWMSTDWEDLDVPPDYVHVQVQWQMTALRVKRGLIGVLLGGSQFRMLEVEHSPDLSDALLELCDSFRRKHVEPRIPPPPDGSASAARLLKGLFPRNRSGLLDATPEAEELAHRLFAARRAAEQDEHEEELARQHLQALIGDAEGMIGTGWQITWRNDKTGGVDWKSVAQALNPPAELIQKYTRPGPRKFLPKEVTMKKGRAA